MKKIFFLLAAVCCLFACTPKTHNEPDDKTKLNQPANPATWSPIGHIYVSSNHPSGNGHDNWTCVFDFFKKDSLARWETYEEDFMDYTKSPNYEKFRYSCEYPNFNHEGYHLNFLDTTSFRIWGYDMLLYR